MSASGPVLILGITGRCGSTFLLELLSRHPDCVKQEKVEDFFLDESDPLIMFRNAMSRRWKRMERGSEVLDALLPAIGRGLLESLDDGRPGRLVTKTPSVRHLDRCFELFPDASVAILVRDPRSVVASAVGSWGVDGEAWARQWARRARTIRDFDERNRGRGLPYSIVRYEDLLESPTATIPALLDSLGLAPDSLDPETVHRVPILGTSESAVDGRVSWEPTERTGDFRPMSRWADWPSQWRARIEWITGAELDAFGYERTTPRRSGAALDQHARSAMLWVRLAKRQTQRRIRHFRQGPLQPAGERVTDR